MHGYTLVLANKIYISQLSADTGCHLENLPSVMAERNV